MNRLNIRGLFWVMLVLTYGALWPLHASFGILQKLAISTYFPSLLTSLPSSWSWIADYFLMAVIVAWFANKIVLFVLNLLFVEPDRNPIHDPTDMAELMSVKVPSFNHLPEALSTCRGMNADAIEIEMTAEGVDVQAPPTGPTLSSSGSFHES